MHVLLSTDGERISPVLDAARCFVLVSGSGDGAQTRKQVLIPDADPIAKGGGDRPFRARPKGRVMSALPGRPNQ